jgi:hypothetical protein
VLPGLCILDLVKHACKTVLATLEANDRFGLVTFESQARCLLPLQFVTEAYREQAMTAIAAMRDMGGTNLWGIRARGRVCVYVCMYVCVCMCVASDFSKETISHNSHSQTLCTGESVW